MRNVFIGPNGIRSGWRAVIFVALVVALGWLAVRLLGPQIVQQSAATGAAPGPGLALYTEFVSACLPVFIATWIMAMIERQPAWSYGLTDSGGVRHFVWGAIWGFVVLSGVVGLLVVTGHLSFDGTALSGGLAFRFAAEWAIGFMLVGMAEEMGLRGYLQYALARGIGFWPAAILLSIAFGAMHISNSGEAVIGELTAGLAGFVFCYSLWRTGSLWWAIGAHMSWDWGQSYFYGVPDSGTNVSDHLLVSHPIGASWLSGGSVGPEGSVFAFLGLIAFVIVIRFTTPRGPALAIPMGHAGHNVTRGDLDPQRSY